MVWGGKGRSGIGDQYTGGTWEDWEGLSTNGRQYKNQLTQETRNLSGSEYWHARKADNPSMFDKVMPNHFNANGSANIQAYIETEKSKSRKKEEPLEYKIFPSQKAFDKIEDLIQTVEKKYLNLEIDDDEYNEMMFALENKLEKAWVKVCKDKGWYESEEKEEEKETAQNTGHGAMSAVRNIVNSVTATLFWRGLIK